MLNQGQDIAQAGDVSHQRTNIARVLRVNEAWTEDINVNVDCSANPYDVRPLANAVMDAQNWLLERLPPDVPLIVVLGENHAFPSHVTAQLAFLDALRKQQKRIPERTFAYGKEEPCNFWAHAYEHSNINISEKDIEDGDHNGKIYLSDIVEISQYSHTPISGLMLTQFNLKKQYFYL